MKNQPLVSIISVNYNQSGLTCQMIDSIKQCAYRNIEIIIVDNASPSDEPDKIKEANPDIHLIKCEQNLGFAGGNNEGVKEAKGKYIFFLNNDTEVDPGFLEPLVEAFENNANLGMASPKIIYHGTDNIIQYAGEGGINPLTGRGKKSGRGEKDMGQFDTSTETALGHGAAMMVPLKVIEEVGLMPDIFFLYYEEHDWCEMIKRAGYKVMYVANATIYHKESMSVGKNSPLKSYYMARNRLIFMRRNSKGLVRLLSILFFIFLTIPKNTLKHLIKFEFKLLQTFLKGVFWNIGHDNVKQNPRLIKNTLNGFDITGAYQHRLQKI
ncbi:glycosyltransferase family 2 protein [Fulvivirgaceae bacterium BMA10]|uniref:Glycosyltransferase family 2 protein n=1 Tax=Splendidivirga corallicola TaxID=3051826 RepID=A0ABT8KHL3_9BACT|nr:glycosyltransferase family 2 protein [Fulvivirgaceae bacterium BMA10]